MIRRLTRMTRLFAVTVALVAVGASSVLASVHVSYDILKEYPTTGMSASWVHSASENVIGNGPSFYGMPMSGRVAGSLRGDLDGDELSNISGSVSGKLKLLSNYLPGDQEMSQTFDLKFGSSAGTGKSGKLKFVSDGTNDFVGGWIDYALLVDGGEVTSGKFFFKPQAENNSSALSPNRGDSTAFTLWGLNWTHDSPANVSGEAYAAFLQSLGQPDLVDRPSTGTLGVALYLSDSSNHAPEPTALIIWGMLAVFGGTCFRRQR